MITLEGFDLDSPNFNQICIARPRFGLLMVDLDLHLQGRLVHFAHFLAQWLVRTIIHEGFNLDSPNLHQICILHRPRLGLLMGDLDLHLQGRSVHFRSNLSKIRLVRTITHEGFNLDSPNWHQICILYWPQLGLLTLKVARFIFLQIVQIKPDQNRLIAGPRGIPLGTDALVTFLSDCIE